jgi:hypothetical protein
MSNSKDRKEEAIQLTDDSQSVEILSALPIRGITKSIQPRPDQSEDGKSAAKVYWERMDQLFYRTIKHAEDAFKVNLALNIVVAGVGLALLSYSIAYSWMKSLDIYSTAFGTLGVVSFVTLFYFTPQRKIQRTTGDLTQMQMIYRTYFMQAEEVNDWYARHPEKSIKDIEKMNKHLQDITSVACSRIEKFIGEKESEKENTVNADDAEKPTKP